MTQPEVKVKAPGKIILIGGYSALEPRNVSFVGAVDAYVTADMTKKPGNEVEFRAPQLGAHAKGTVEAQSGRIEANVQEELLLLKSAADVALRYVSGLGIEASGFSMTTKTDAAFAYSLSSGKVAKSGLGSSAAVTVAAVGAVLRSFGVGFQENDALHKLSQIAHYAATGKTGSGIDITASAHGSVICTRCPSETLRSLPDDYSGKQLVDLVRSKWDQKIEKFTLPEEFRLLYATFGDAMITSAAVSKVYEFKERDPDIYKDIIGEINSENEKAVEALRRIKKGDLDAFREFASAFDKGRSLTKKLGVFSGVGIEPDDCTELIEESKKNGAIVAKLPGAGGRDAIVALSVDEKSRSSLLGFWKSRKELKVLDVGMIADGATVLPVKP